VRAGVRRAAAARSVRRAPRALVRAVYARGRARRAHCPAGGGLARRVLRGRYGRLPLDLRGTPWELDVWRRLLDILPGSTRTYGAIARELRKPNGARAVGLAVGANPVSLIVPCHRVVGTSGSLTGYGGGLHRKEWLLRHEMRWSREGDRRLF
jgi:methylated-DNA-[protein]-cysteine S-methyltransferase